MPLSGDKIRRHGWTLPLATNPVRRFRLADDVGTGNDSMIEFERCTAERSAAGLSLPSTTCDGRAPFEVETVRFRRSVVAVDGRAEPRKGFSGESSCLGTG